MARLYRTLITGIEVTDLEAVLTYDMDVVPNESLAENTSRTARRPSNLSLISLSQSPLNLLQVSWKSFAYLQFGVEL